MDIENLHAVLKESLYIVFLPNHSRLFVFLFVQIFMHALNRPLRFQLGFYLLTSLGKQFNKMSENSYESISLQMITIETEYV